MNIGSLAKQANVNIQTVRYYERIGILKATARRDSGYRVYDQDSLKRLVFIKRAQELGFTLDEVEELLHLNAGGPDSCDAARELAQSRRADLETRIVDLQRMHDSLTDLIATCELPAADRACALLDAIAKPTPHQRPGADHD